MEIIKDFIAKGRNRPEIPMKPVFITIHNTGNTTKGADALSHSAYLKTPEARNIPVSWHFTVDDKRIVQHLPTNEVGWHATDGHGAGNMSSIGIEICVNCDGDYTRAEQNAIELIRQLMQQHNILIENVVPHQKWYPAKFCPNKILPRWNQFINEIKGVKPDMVTYTVVAGDNLTKIAGKFGVTLEDIKRANLQVKDFNILNVGDRLNIPVIVPQPEPDSLSKVPEWVRPSIKKLYDRKLVTEPTGDTTFYRVIYIMDKLGLLNN